MCWDRWNINKVAPKDYTEDVAKKSQNNSDKGNEQSLK